MIASGLGANPRTGLFFWWVSYSGGALNHAILALFCVAHRAAPGFSVPGRTVKNLALTATPIFMWAAADVVISAIAYGDPLLKLHTFTRLYPSATKLPGGHGGYVPASWGGLCSTT